VSFESSAVAVGKTVSTHSPAFRLRNVSELRLFFAASVMLSHAARLANPDGHLLFRTILNSEAAVQGFFILSGFLVCGSYARIGEPVRFYERRLLRIFPGYIVAVLLFLTLGLAQAVLRDVPVAWNELPRYLVANLTTLNFLQPTVDGVFAGNPIEVINGALWSIKVELMFYASLPILYAIGQRTSFAVLAALLIAGGTLYWPVLSALSDAAGVAISPSFRDQLPGQLHFFGLGIALYAHSSGQIGKVGMAALALWAPFLLVIFSGSREAIQVLVLVGIIAGATALPQMPDLFPGRDLSYGIYLSHFPLIQLLLAAGMGAAPLPLFMACVVFLSVAYAFASWQLVERPALGFKRR
jgi:peptidoglycan/LPS O-acetylase OafA/YrhL